MPLFTYECRSCHYEFETIEKFSSRKRKQECPKCGLKEGQLVERIEATNYSLNRSFSRMRLGK